MDAWMGVGKLGVWGGSATEGVVGESKSNLEEERRREECDSVTI